jgi:hypothetical protein
MRKGQVRWVSGTDIGRQNQFINNVWRVPSFYEMNVERLQLTTFFAVKRGSTARHDLA